MVGAVLVATSCLASPAGNAFAPIERYLTQFGIGPGLPALRVVYSNDTAQVSLRGSATELLNEADADSALLKRQPDVSWARDPDGRTYSLAFIDLGRDTGTTSAPSATWTRKPFFPCVHSIWTLCTRHLADCQITVQSYLPPGNRATVPNRYTWVLFRHDAARAAPLVLAGRSAASLSKSKASLAAIFHPFDLRKFLVRDNPGLEAVAYNFMHVSGLAKPKPTRRLEADR
jgi:hypothetical protein